MYKYKRSWESRRPSVVDWIWALAPLGVLIVWYGGLTYGVYRLIHYLLHVLAANGVKGL